MPKRYLLEFDHIWGTCTKYHLSVSNDSQGQTVSAFISRYILHTESSFSWNNKDLLFSSLTSFFAFYVSSWLRDYCLFQIKKKIKVK